MPKAIPRYPDGDDGGFRRPPLVLRPGPAPVPQPDGDPALGGVEEEVL